MAMEQYRYRRAAWVIAIIDLVLAVLSVLGLIGFVIFGALLSVAVTDPRLKEELVHEIGQGANKNDADTAVIAIRVVLWIMIALIAVQVFLQFAAAVKLLNGTQPSENPTSDLKRCQFWRIVSIVFLVLNVLGIFGLFATPLILLMFIPDIIFRSVGLYIVGNFMKELEASPKFTSGHHGNLGTVYSPLETTAPLTASDPPAYAYDKA